MTAKLDPKTVNILWATPEQAKELAPMHARLFDPAWDETAFRDLLTHPATTAFVAQVGTPLLTVGFIIGQLAADEAEILTVGIAPELQRRGYGRLLVEALGRAAKRAEAKRMFLEVAASNDAAIALYRKIGFDEVGKRGDYYAKPGGTVEDALILSLKL